MSLRWPRLLNSLSAPRSSGWKEIRRLHLQKFPECEACGARKSVIPHHIIPFHIDSSKELDPENLVSLCESRTFNCHLFFGHLKRWDRHNPNVVQDAKSWRSRIREAEQKE